MEDCMSRILLSLLISTMLLPVPQAEVVNENVGGKQAEEIVREAIKAHGGEEVLKKTSCFVLRSKGWYLFPDGERCPYTNQTWRDGARLKAVSCVQQAG